MSDPSPLAAFSRYLSGRHQVLLGIADEISRHLDACASGEAPTPGPRARASDLMWLWTLGAYEVTRTMCQAHACFAPTFLMKLSELKAELERVRVPNTKMERIKYDRKGETIPVPSDRPPDVWDPSRKDDILVGDPADLVSARTLLTRYVRIMGSLRAEDVLMSHEDSFRRR